MKSLLQLFFCLLLGLLADSLSAQANSMHTVVSVNGTSLSAKYFTKSYIQHLRVTGVNDTREERYAHLESLINEMLLAQQFFLYGLEEWELNQYTKKVEKKIRSDIFFNRAFMDTLSSPSDLDVREAFFKSKMKVYARQLFFTDSSEANKRFDQLQNGASFVQLANEVFDLQEFDSLAGYLGEMTYFGVDPAVAEEAFSLRAGEYSKPIRSRFGYHIIKVDERVINPLITEAEYKAKYEGINDQEKRRILAQSGDRFVHDYMGSLNTKINTQNIEQLFNAVSKIGSKENTSIINQVTPKKYATSADVEFIEEEFNPNTVLASYTHLGKNQVFTAGDYYFWLEFIPLNEAKNQTIASVGRALRNEVFSEAAKQFNLENDDDFNFEVQYHIDNYKSWKAKQYLLSQEKEPVPEQALQHYYTSFGLNKIEEAKFTGWMIRASDFETSRLIKKNIETGENNPDEFEHFQEYENEDILSFYELRSELFRVLPQSIHVVSTSNDFYVLFVEDRILKRTSFEESIEEIERRLGSSYNIVLELQRLREEAEIRVDTTRFEFLMEHFNDPGLRGNPQ